MKIIYFYRTTKTYDYYTIEEIVYQIVNIPIDTFVFAHFNALGHPFKFIQYLN